MSPKELYIEFTKYSIELFALTVADGLYKVTFEAEYSESAQQ
jgi:hypothetical protein